MNKQNNIVRTKMAEAMIGAVHSAVKRGHRTGWLGRVILTNEAKGVGVKLMPREKRVLKAA